MTVIYFSAATGGFYSPEINTDLPADAVAITTAQHADLLAAQSAGKLIVADGKGNPVAIDPPPPSLDALRAGALAKLSSWESCERAAGIDNAGHHWLTTPAALQDIRDCLLAGTVPGGVWVDAERQSVPMTLPELQSLWQTIVACGGLIYRRRVEMEEAIATMTPAQLEAFKPGWP